MWQGEHGAQRVASYRAWNRRVRSSCPKASPPPFHVFVNGVEQHAGHRLRPDRDDSRLPARARPRGQARLLAVAVALPRRRGHLPQERHGRRRLLGRREPARRDARAARAPDALTPSKLLGRGDRRRGPCPLRRDRRFAVARPGRAAAPRPPLAVRPLPPAARRVLDRRGDLGRHLARALDVDPAPAPPGRLAAALLHAARRSGCACSATAKPRRTRSRSSSGLACVPLAYFATRAVFGRTAALAAAVLAALDPFLTYYAQETRMYELEALLSLVVAWSYVEGILRGRRALDAGLRRRDRAARVQPQLGALPLRRARRRDVRVRARALAPVRGRRGRCRCALRAVAPDAALAGAAHRRAVVDAAELSRSLPLGGHRHRRRRAVRRARARRRRGARRRPAARADAGAARDRRAPHGHRGDGRRRVRRLADLARVDRALLRGASSAR